jgi:hypothetical protein
MPRVPGPLACVPASERGAQAEENERPRITAAYALRALVRAAPNAVKPFVVKLIPTVFLGMSDPVDEVRWCMRSALGNGGLPARRSTRK